MKNCVIIHGSNPREKEIIRQGSPPQNERNWIPWLKDKLMEKGIDAYAPLMPNSWKPKFEEWKNILEKFDINEESTLVGHSAGGAFLVRWLGESNKRVKKLILIAPAKKLNKLNKDEMGQFYDFQINKNINNNVKEVLIFVADNEWPIIKESVKIYEKELDVKKIELKGMGHFMTKYMGTDEFPELLEEVLN